MNRRALIWVAVSSLSQADIDKVSLDEQERACREWCETNNVQIVGVLRVPGYSRSESDVVAALEEFTAQGVTAYSDLRAAWRARSFDVLVAYHSSRLGRSQSLYTYVVENTIKAGASVQCILGGMIDSANAEFGIAFGGVQARGEQRRFVEMTKVAKLEQIKRGLPWGLSAWSHVVVRDERGKGICLAPDERKRPVIDALSQLVLEGLAWRNIPAALRDRFGYVAESGLPYHFKMFYNMFYTPPFWGHNSAGSFAAGATGHGLWAFGDGDIPPDGVQLFLNTHEPFYPTDSEMSNALRTELRRRTQFAKGRSGYSTRALSRLLVCAKCGTAMSYSNVKKLICVNKYAELRTRRCNETQSIPIAHAREWIQAFLSQFLEEGDIQAAFTGNAPQKPDFAPIQRQIDSLSQRIQRLAGRLADVPDEAVSEVNLQMKTLVNERSQLQSRLELERSKSAAQERERQHSRRALDSITEIGWDAFWKLDELTINQTLHAIFGLWRLEVRDSQIVSLRRLG